MEKVMGIDIGTKRIGVAISDYLQIVAEPFGMIEREPQENAVLKIKKICEEYKIKKIIIGLPLNMDGSIGEQAKDCMKFADNFKENYDIIYEDERLTSDKAKESIKNKTAKKCRDIKQKGLIDIKSACIILQQYLGRK